MRGSKKILIGVGVVCIAMQFIQPVRNKSERVPPTDILNIYRVPLNVQVVLRRSCYDCHSNTTRYPWYVNIEPVGWLLSYHIRKGKSKLNFNEFGTYSTMKQSSKLREIEMSIDDGTMPISSYLLIHKDARLTPPDKKKVADWINKTRDSLTATEQQ